MPDKFKSISDVIQKESAFEKVRLAAREYDILKEFVKIFPDLEEVAVPVKIERQILYLRVENSVWRSELNFNQKKIIEKINSYYKETVIKSIKFIS